MLEDKRDKVSANLKEISKCFGKITVEKRVKSTVPASQ